MSSVSRAAGVPGFARLRRLGMCGWIEIGGSVSVAGARAAVEKVIQLPFNLPKRRYPYIPVETGRYCSSHPWT
jgi:hypothetical protein